MRTIVHLSDIHFGRTEASVVEGCVADVNDLKPSLVVMSGDFTQRARAGQYQEAMAFMRRLPQTQLVVPGNHELPLINIVDHLLRTMRNYHMSDNQHQRP